MNRYNKDAISENGYCDMRCPFFKCDGGQIEDLKCTLFDITLPYYDGPLAICNDNVTTDEHFAEIIREQKNRSFIWITTN